MIQFCAGLNLNSLVNTLSSKPSLRHAYECDGVQGSDARSCVKPL